MSENKARRLPNGELTTDVRAYCDAWDEFAAPLERALGWKMVAFDSEVVFKMPDGERVRLPTGAVDSLNTLVNSRGKEA